MTPVYSQAGQIKSVSGFSGSPPQLIMYILPSRKTLDSGCLKLTWNCWSHTSGTKTGVWWEVWQQDAYHQSYGWGEEDCKVKLFVFNTLVHILFSFNLIWSNMQLKPMTSSMQRWKCLTIILMFDCVPLHTAARLSWN